MLYVFNALKMHSSFIIDSALNKPFNTSVLTWDSDRKQDRCFEEERPKYYIM